MTRIGLISDTHGWLDENVFNHFTACDEVWHAGDIGDLDIAKKLSSSFKNFKAVYGNIDDNRMRFEYPEQLIFNCEKVKVMIRHICGSPPKYNPATIIQINEHRPALIICGHSHILKIQYDQANTCLFMNPGAAGKQGWHKTRTIVCFTIDGSEIKDCEVIELGNRGG